MTGYASYREKVSEIFLEVGRTAPRHAELASIYPGKGRLHSAMIEYSIVVVEMCQSLFQQSPLQRFKTSLKTAITDPQLQKIKSSLAMWSREISDEVIMLQSRRLEETDRGSGIRSIISSISESDRRQKRARERVKWLDACGDYDYERHRNLTRRSGNAEYFLHDPSYLKWRDWSGPATLICEGKLGSGKSVLMANMVDDLLLGNTSDTYTTAFYFVSDDTAGHNARTALGSIARQILESLPDAQWTDKLNEESRSLTTNRLTQILGKAVASMRRIYLILDGFDEFPEVERKILVEQLKELQSWLQLRICISWRLEAKSRAREDFDTFGQSATLNIPTINPDIEKFVKTEVDALLETGELSIRDDAIVDEIQQRLVEGADGM
jgi:ankyrin repeat domain-containing protein 50